MPQRIPWQTDGAASPDNADALLQNNWGQALARAVPCCTMTHRGEAPGILLDFGRELHGSLQLVTGPLVDNLPIRARLRFGESASEAMSEPNNDHALHDAVIFLTSMAAQEYSLTGFRFARLDLLDEGDVLPLVAARAITLMRPEPQIGSFRCSDERLNEIWQVGAHTVHLCMQDYVWDGCKRDRLVWLGDMHPEVSVISAVWGAHPIVPQSLDWVRDRTPLPEWMNGIHSYSMWWVLIQRDWFIHHGDREYLEAQRSYLTGLLGIFSAAVQEDGTTELDGWKFLDWPSSPFPAAVESGIRALLLMTLRAGVTLCEVLGEAESSSLCTSAAERLLKNPPPLPVESKQASSLLVLAELADSFAVNSEVLANEPLQGISTFYGYYVLQARAAAGDYSGALEVIRRYWGGMLDLGATSFWEHFDISWLKNAGRIDELPQSGMHDVHAEYGDYCFQGHRHSLCHGWAAGPTAWLSEHVLGFRPLEPGCSELQVVPHLEDLAWAEGTFPTPHGPVTVRHERRADGTVTSEIHAPAEVTVVRG